MNTKAVTTTQELTITSVNSFYDESNKTCPMCTCILVASGRHVYNIKFNIDAEVNNIYKNLLFEVSRITRIRASG